MLDPSTNRPAPPAATVEGSGERERARIDSGRTGDKVAVNDPAASPLGTDDEAGCPPDPNGMATARQVTRPG